MDYINSFLYLNKLDMTGPYWASAISIGMNSESKTFIRIHIITFITKSFKNNITLTFKTKNL